MKSLIMTLFTRTPLHVGAGNSVGVVDAPIQRERHTRIPIIPGSAIKGVLADLWPIRWEKEETSGKLKSIREPETRWLFGVEDAGNAASGALIVGEARVLAFPVRSAKNGFAWITCPLALRRFARDTGSEIQIQEPTREDRCFAPADLLLDGNSLILEEYRFECEGPVACCEALSRITNDTAWGGMEKRLAIVKDEIFSHFAEHACEIVTRIRIDDMTGTVAGGALFNQEQVPAETVFYAVIHAQKEKRPRPEPQQALRGENEVFECLKKGVAAVGNVLQFGGDETTGLGFCTVSWIEGR